MIIKFFGYFLTKLLNKKYAKSQINFVAACLFPATEQPRKKENKYQAFEVQSGSGAVYFSW